jgi:hypothetical protein
MDCIEDHNQEGEMEKEGGREKEKYTGSIMTVTRPDTPLCEAPARSRGEDDDMPLGDEMPAWTISAWSSDDGSTTSVASEETVCWANLKCPKLTHWFVDWMKTCG